MGRCPKKKNQLLSRVTCAYFCEMDIFWIILLLVGLREAVNQALLRERYHEYNLRNRLLDAPLIGKQDALTPFGDIVILARGQLYITHEEKFVFVQDQYQNDCDACHNPRPRCIRRPCQVWQPDENEHLVALWTVKRIRHRSHNGHYYELEYIVSPISPAISPFVTRNGNFDYSIPGHIFVVKNDRLSPNQPELQPTVANNKHIPHHRFKPEIIIGITPDGERHILHSYPGFYTSFPVHPTYHQNGYSTNDPKEIALYKELIESLAVKTSTTQKAQTGPHTFPINDYTQSADDEVSSIKPNYDSFPPTENSMVQLPTGQLVPLTKITSPLGSSTVANNPIYTSIQFPHTNQQNIITKPSIMNIIPTKPTELNIQGKFSNVNTEHPRDTPDVTPPVTTTIHYFTPIGEEELIVDNIIEMKKITLGTTTTKKPMKQKSEESGSDFLFPIKTTTPSKTIKKYKPTTQDRSNFLQEQALSPTQTTKQYHTSATRTRPESVTTIKTTPNKTITKTTIKYTTKITTPSTTGPKSSTTIAKFSTPKITKTTTGPKTTYSSTTEGVVPITTASKSNKKIETINTTEYKTSTEVPNTTTVKITTLKLQTKTKQSNLTGFLAGTSASTSANKITTYKPKPTKVSGIKPSKNTKLNMTESTPLTTQILYTKESTKKKSILPTTFIKATTQQQAKITDSDYSLLEEISPTEPMLPTSLKSQETRTTSISYQVNNYPDTIPSQTTITTTHKPDEVDSDDIATTKTGNISRNTFTPTTYTYTLIPTTEVTKLTTESSQASTVTQENINDESFITQKESEITSKSITKMTLSDIDNLSPLSTTELNTDAETLKSTIATNFNTESISTTNNYDNTQTTLPTSLQHNKPIPTVTIKTTTSKIKLATSVMNDFLTENGYNGEEPSLTKLVKTDVDEDDIFGNIKIETKPRKTPTIKEITESDLASDLFGNRRPEFFKTDTTVSEGTRIIYSNFFEASTTPLSHTAEYVKPTEIHETTINLKPSTSQSYATSISFEVNKKNNSTTEYNATSTDRENTVDDFMVKNSKPSNEMSAVTTEASSEDTKKALDHLALQLVNHAKSIHILSGNDTDISSGSNNTNRTKYKRRKTYIPKNRRMNRKQVS